jgi:adenosylhomocysteine nucleosidase
VNTEINVFEGRVVSGDQFVSDSDVKERLVKMFDPYCTEMEGAAIAQAAWLNDIPFVIIRAISDKADGSAHMDYSEFEAQAIEHTVKLLLAAVPLI